MDAAQAASVTGEGDELEEVSDEILVQRATDGDTDAFAVLITRYGPMLRAYTTRLVGSVADADDVVQETFYRAWRKLPTLRDPAAVRGWLVRIATRLAITELRRSDRRGDELVSEPLTPDSSDPSAVAERSAAMDALSTALAALPERERQSWLLREVAGLSYRDIAEILGVPESTVRGLLARARADLFVRMEGWR